MTHIFVAKIRIYLVKSFFWVHKIAYYHRNLYFCIVNKKKIYEYLSSAESGNLKAQGELCQVFFNDKEISRAMSGDFWDRVYRIAQEGKDYANFIMHCRYFDDPSQSRQSFDYIRKAIRHKDVPLAVLRLGVSFAQGIGTIENHVLANYYYEMALTMGCQEAIGYIDHEYDTGRRSILHDVEKAIKRTVFPPPQLFALLKVRIEKERAKKNYGHLSVIRDYITIFYPDYDPEKAVNDILNDKDTIDADICYSMSTPSNHSECNVDLLDSMQEQLFAPITQDQELFQAIIECGYADLVNGSDREILQCIVNLTSSYDNICDKFEVDRKEIAYLDPTEVLPYIKVSFMTLLRRQVFRCILSIKDIDPIIEEQFLNHLDSEEQLLNICETIKDQDVQMFLISFVELNIDVETSMLDLHSLLDLYRNHRLDALVKRLNDFIRTLTDAGIEHHLPEFTIESLPRIELA